MHEREREREREINRSYVLLGLTYYLSSYMCAQLLVLICQSPPQSFLSDLCEVEDFHESLQLEEYIALCRKDIGLEITVAEMACLHTLLLKYREDIVSHLV